MSHSTLVTSDLISLNIHDSFTFDGVEIAINPDIFNHSTLSHNRESGYHTRDSSYASTSSVFPSSSLNASFHSSGETNESAIHNVMPAVPLRGGDIIEIRVWDRNDKKDVMEQSYPERRNSDPKGANLFLNEHGHPRLITTRPPVVPRNISTASSSGFSPKIDQTMLQTPSNRSPKAYFVNHQNEMKPILTPSQGALESKSFLAAVASDEESDSNKIVQEQHDGGASVLSHLEGLSINADDLAHGNRSRTSSHNSMDSKYQDNSILGKISKNYTERDKFVVKISDKSLTALKSGARTQFSMLRQVADLYELATFDMITITKIDDAEKAAVLQSCSADYVTMTVKEQFINRGEMYQFQNSFQGRWFYKGERLSTPEGIRGTVMEIRNEGNEFKSAFITEDTKITFRSRSARILWLVQMSAEMWDYASPYENGASFSYGQGSCERYFDKFVTFMHKLFDEWKALEVTHSLTVVFFSRTYIRSNSQTNFKDRPSSTIKRDFDGRLYEDSYKVVLENITKPDWDSLIVNIKEAFLSFPVDLNWRLGTESRLPSSAAQGNILEAINTGLNLLQLHYIDRDLNRVGNSIVVVSAGSGVFEVDNDLAAITKQRMMDNGIGSDMLSLGLPPLHVAPFMLYKEKPNETDEEKDDWKAFFEIPHWMHLSFISYDKMGPVKSTENRKKTDDPVTEPFNQPKFRTHPNGFVVYEKDNPITERQISSERITLTQHQQRHLILGRDFEDILEACRPRHYGLATGGVPSALSAHLKLLGLCDTVPKNDSKVESKVPAPEAWGSIPDSGESSLFIRLDGSDQNASLSSSLEAARVSMNRRESHASDFSYSDISATSSHFAAHFSLFLSRSPANVHMDSETLKSIQIQQDPSSFDLHFDKTFDERYRKRNKSSDSLLNDGYDSIFPSRAETDSNSGGSSNSITNLMQQNSFNPEEILQAMNDHDSMTFRNIPASSPGSRRPIANANSQSNTEEFKGKTFEDAPSAGIGAALNQYENSSRSITRNESSALIRLKKSMNAASSSNLHGRARSFGMGYSLDDNIGLNISNHEVHPIELGGSVPRMLVNDTILEEGISISLKGTPTRFSTTPPKFKGINAFSSTRNRSPNHDSKQKWNKKSQRNSMVYNKFQMLKTAPPSQSRRKRWVLNPFRQEDEEEVLAKRTHNSRRWSHVFPKGEIEFKRHAGPNWKSLCQPAILPVTIDVYPTPKELNDASKYLFRNYQLNLYAMDATNYDNHSDLVMEMVRQRIVQDFQLVPQSVIKQSEMSFEKPEKINTTALIEEKEETKIQHTLSMGHRIHIISCDPSSDSVDVVEYLAKFAVGNSRNKAHVFNYNYNIWMPSTSRFEQATQQFQRFPEIYPWNLLDTMICGDSNETLTESTRFRRRGFRIIPDYTKDGKGSEEYVKSFKKLVDFFEKQAKKPIPIRFNSEQEKDTPSASETINHQSMTNFDSMIRVIIPLRKSKRDNFEWLEMCLDREFHPRSSYRIAFHWLVASAIKVDAQVQMLQRRCIQYGLRLVPTPQLSLHSNMFLNPFQRPECIYVESNEKARIAELSLIDRFGFVDDGKPVVFARDVLGFNVKLKTQEQLHKRSTIQKKAAAQQYIHLSGTMFVRLLPDTRGGTAFVILQNRIYISSSDELQSIANNLFDDLKNFLHELNKSQEENK